MSFELPEDLDGVDFLTKEDVIDIHDNVALIEGGATGILKEDDLLGSIGRPVQVALYDVDADFIKSAAY